LTRVLAVGQPGDVVDAVAVHGQVVVEHPARIGAALGQVLEEVQGQGRVVDLPRRRGLEKAVAVVEGAHHRQGLVGLRGGQLAVGDDLLQHGGDLGLVEAAEVRQLRLQ
jgi:hypothetical protein